MKNDADHTTRQSAPARASGLIEEQRGFVIETFKNGLKFAEQISKTAATLPWTLLESMGVAEEKTRGPKEFNLKLVGGVFRLTNKMAARALAVVAAPTRSPGGTTPPADTPPAGRTSDPDDTGADGATTPPSQAPER